MPTDLQQQTVNLAAQQQRPQYLSALRQARWNAGAKGTLGSGQTAMNEAGLQSQANAGLSQVAANQAMKGADLSEQRRLEAQQQNWQRTQMENQYAAQLDARMRARKAAEGMQEMQAQAGIWRSLASGGGNIAGQLIGSKLGGGQQQQQQAGGIQNVQMPQSGPLSSGYQPMSSDPYAYNLG